MTNENELKVVATIHRLQRIKNLGKTSLNSVNSAAALINEQQAELKAAEAEIDRKVSELRRLINDSDDQAEQNWQSLADPHWQGVTAGLSEALNMIDHIFGESKPEE